MVACSTLLVAGPTWYRELRRGSRWSDGSSRLFRFISGNLAAFVCFFGTGGRVLEGTEAVYPLDWVFFAAWLASGTAVLVFWAMAVLPADLWIRVIRQSWGSMLAGVVLGFAVSGAGVLAVDQ